MNTPTRKICVLVGLISAALWFAGCIEFEQQTLAYRFDPSHDTLLIHQTYHGIHGGSEGATDDSLKSSEAEELRTTWLTEQTFFFSNWIFALNLPQIRSDLAKEPPPAADAVESAAASALHLLRSLLLANTRISNGPFHRDADGHLCGVQRVTVTNVSAIVAAGNDALRTTFAVEARADSNDAAKRAQFARALSDPLPYLTITGNRITVRFPTSPEDFTAETTAAAGRTSTQLAAFSRAGGSATFANGMVTVAFGHQDSTHESLTIPFTPGDYRANAVSFAREQFGIAESFDPLGDRERFLSPLPPAAE